MTDLLIQCILCAAMAFGHYGNMPLAGVGQIPIAGLSAPYVGLIYAGWTWHSPLPLTAESPHPWPYRIQLPTLGIQPDLWLEPREADWTEGLDVGTGWTQYQKPFQP